MAKMLKHIKSFGLAAVSIGLVLALLLGSVVPAKAAEERAVKIGLHGAFTGPLASSGVFFGEGALDYVRHLNEVQGGIDGVRVEIPWEDTKALVAQSMSAHKRFKEKGVVAELIVETGPCEVLAPIAQRDKTPILYEGGPSEGMLTSPLRWVFGVVFSVDAWGTACAYWIEDRVWAEERPPRIGIVIFDVAAVRSVMEGVKRYADELGYEFIGYETVPLLAPIDTTVEWLRMAAREPDWVIIACYASSLVTVVKDVARLEIAKKGIGLITSPAALDEVMVRIIGKDSEGLYSSQCYPSPTVETELPEMKVLLEAAKKYRGYEPEKMTTWYVVGWTNAMVAVEAIRLAIEKVGIENLSGQSVRDALASIKDFDTGLLPPGSMSDDKP